MHACVRAYHDDGEEVYLSLRLGLRFLEVDEDGALRPPHFPIRERVEVPPVPPADENVLRFFSITFTSIAT